MTIDVRRFPFAWLLLALLGTACGTPAQRQTGSEPESGEYVASSRGRVFYWVGCDGWRSLSPGNRRFFGTRDEAVAAGYRPSRDAGCAGPGAGAARVEPPPAPVDDQCLVARITDGDTLRCAGGERVRLLLIDAPERSQEDFGLRARLALEEMVPVGSSVRLELDAQERDRYGRLLAHVHSADGVWANREMVRRGYALVAVYPPNVRHVEAFRAELAEAREAGRGLWAYGGFACAPANRRRGRC